MLKSYAYPASSFFLNYLLLLLYAHGQPQISEAVCEQARRGVRAAEALRLFVVGSALQGVVPVLAQLHHHLR